jgi:hypothetical protein
MERSSVSCSPHNIQHSMPAHNTVTVRTLFGHAVDRLYYYSTHQFVLLQTANPLRALFRWITLDVGKYIHAITDYTVVKSVKTKDSGKNFTIIEWTHRITAILGTGILCSVERIPYFPLYVLKRFHATLKNRKSFKCNLQLQMKEVTKDALLAGCWP